MQSATRSYTTAGLLLSLFLAGGLAGFAGTPALDINVPAHPSVPQDDDRDEPDVKARVARISFIHGSAKVRHAGEKDWVKATLNLPVVEGDELVTDDDSRIEVQFDKDQHLRLEENSYLKVTSLRFDGIAVSINIGSINVRLRSFNKDAQFFEIDAPKTTIALEKSGSYRVDAGREGSTEVRTSVRADGEARVYSDTAGFTLKNDRSAKISIDGPNAGEWETTDAAKTADDFDAWALDRDDVIARRLKSASYGTYYDDDIYGADDLTDFGAWTYTRDYGWIWKPYPSAVSQYAGWSPYRYGQWNWVPPFGWTWVGDEPWSWATYHHGRWVWVSGSWVWAPYGYYRPARSWWFPALVAINVVVNDVCWYPLSYHHRYRSYNDHHGGPVRNDPIRNTNNGPDRGAIRLGDPNAQGPTPGTIVRKPVGDDASVPLHGVVALDRKSFGGVIRGHTLSQEVAQTVIKTSGGSAKLPDITEVKRTGGRDLVTEQPRLAGYAGKLGAADRRNGGPVDEELRRTRILGGREPVRTDANGTDATRKMGAVDRDLTRHTQIRQPDPSTGNGGMVRNGDSNGGSNGAPGDTKRMQSSPTKTDPPRDQPRDIKRSTPSIRVEPRHDPPQDVKRSNPVKTERQESPKPTPVKKEPSAPPPSRVDRKAAPIDGR